MTYFPIFMNLIDRNCLVVGGCSAAAAKTRRLLAAGAIVRVITPNPNEELSLLAQRGEIVMDRRPFQIEDLEGKTLVISASGSKSKDTFVSESARRLDVPVNVVDSISLSDFIVPSVVDRGPIQIGISTGGASPVFGSRLRSQIEQLMPSNIGEFVGLLGRNRSKIKELIPDIRMRRRFWNDFILSNSDRNNSVTDEIIGRAVDKFVRSKKNRSVTNGEVAIVGAGPGDPEMLTIRAVRKLQDADVIVYDRLVPLEILERGRREAKRIFVGKSKEQHTCGQDEIHQILLRESQSGNRVVRLKGGDPFIFGRGGEERSFLLSHGISVEVVPGITAALGCGAATGIPMTYRNAAQAVTFITGHGDGELQLDWGSLARMEHTLVIYMGIGTAQTIARNLMQHGMKGETPVAVVANGTQPNQKSVRGNLKELDRLISENNLRAPAVIIVGAVVHEAEVHNFVGRIKESTLEKHDVTDTSNFESVS